MAAKLVQVWVALRSDIPDTQRETPRCERERDRERQRETETDLVEDQCLEVPEVKALRVLQVVNNAA